MPVDLPREIALKILYEINEKGAYSNIAINKHVENPGLRDIDKVFITGLVYGTIKWRLSIDFVIGQFSKLPMKKLSPWILNILRLGIYQILYTDKIPVSAACNESVSLALKYGHKASGGFVNGILRNVARNKDNIVYPDKNADLIRYLSIKYSHQEWMIKKWAKLYGEEFTENLLQSNNENPVFSIAVNTLKISREGIRQKLHEEGIDCIEGKYSDNALKLENPAGIVHSYLHKEGYFQIQDEASMLVSKVLDPAPGELVIDVCAAPGGKTANIAQMMNNCGTVVARDIHPHKIKLIEEASKRLGLNIVKTQLFNAEEIDPSCKSRADRVLVDAPCSGLGIIRRKPDIKWTRTPEDMKTIPPLQFKILCTAAEYVKPGGVLVYSTCTIMPDENIDVVSKFLELNSYFKMVGFETLLPKGLIKETAGEGYVQLFPNVEGIDGFFIAKLMRKG